MWFRIKREWSFTRGASLLHEMITRVRALSPQVKEILFPVIRRSSFFAHAENIINC